MPQPSRVKRLRQPLHADWRIYRWEVGRTERRIHATRPALDLRRVFPIWYYCAMKIQMRLIAVVLGITTLVGMSGCETPSKPSSSILASADYGQPIGQSDAQRMADAYLARSLKDPESRRVTWGPVTKGYERIHRPGDQVGWSFSSDSASNWVFGYKMVAGVNAKNSYGGYTGEKAYTFIFKDSKLAAVFTWVERVSTSGSYPVHERIYP